MEAAALPRADDTRIAVIGLGYVGLPLAVAFGRKLPTLGFDIDAKRVAELREYRDHTLEVSPEELQGDDEPARQLPTRWICASCNVFIVTVPTPIDEYKRPDLTAAGIGQPHGRQGDRSAAAW